MSHLKQQQTRQQYSHIQGASFWNGHFKKIRAEPTGDPMREWINTVPNDGVIWYKAQFNTERILITNPKALADVLVNNSYDFIKPKQLAQTIGRILGIGMWIGDFYDELNLTPNRYIVRRGR